MSSNVLFDSEKAENFLEDLEALKRVMKEDFEELLSSWERLKDDWDDSQLDEFENIFVQGCTAVLQETANISPTLINQLEEQLAIAQKLNQLSFESGSSGGSSSSQPSSTPQGTALTPATINSLQKVAIQLSLIQLAQEAKTIGQKGWATWQLFTLLSTPMLGGTIQMDVDISSPAPEIGNVSTQTSHTPKGEQSKSLKKVVDIVKDTMKSNKERERDKRKREAEIAEKVRSHSDSKPSSF